ncbi:hypothetical protein B0H14DRAFT_3532471 [Mycena olivaceomarginata]|nr:hypothetical protein B0H14DRAFT_3532471 [Mycena olivaceomarginata]
MSRPHDIKRGMKTWGLDVVETDAPRTRSPDPSLFSSSIPSFGYTFVHVYQLCWATIITLLGPRPPATPLPIPAPPRDFGCLPRPAIPGRVLLCSHPPRPAVVHSSERTTAPRAFRAALNPESTGWAAPAAAYLLHSGMAARPREIWGRNGTDGDGRRGVENFPRAVSVYSAARETEESLSSGRALLRTSSGKREAGGGSCLEKDGERTEAGKKEHGMEWVSAVPEWRFEIASSRVGAGGHGGKHQLRVVGGGRGEPTCVVMLDVAAPAC